MVHQPAMVVATDEGFQLGSSAVIVLGACVHLVHSLTNPALNPYPNARATIRPSGIRAQPPSKVDDGESSAHGHAAAMLLPCGLELVLAGAVARTVAQAVIHPLDTIKTRLQVSAPSKDLRQWQQGFKASCKAVRALGLRFPSAIGFQGLYAGLTGAVLTTLPAAAVFFAVDGACKQFLQQHDGASNKDSRTTLVHMGSACVASVASAFIRVPGDVLKHRVQAFMYPNVWVAAQKVWRTTGLRGMYCGFGATLLRDMPEMTIQFTLYEALRRAFTPARSVPSSSNAPSGPHPMLLGAAAGAAAAVATTPIDVIKSQLQCQAGTCNAWVAVDTILQQRGMAGLVSGMAPRVLQTSLCSAVFFTLFEAFKAHMSHMRQQELQASTAHRQIDLDNCSLSDGAHTFQNAVRPLRL